ncbi:MAG TPA: ABC transporter substrate-binding protein [Anaerolineales bacterium]|nr:ABC transporter substrate-binding protein [Anaerolineales bacterium]
MKPRKDFVYLSLIAMLAMVLGACQPAAAPTAAPATQPPAAAPTSAPAGPEPAACGEEGTIVIAYDGDIDHIEPMEFRSIAAYDATANLYEPLIQQELVDQGDNVFIGSETFVGAGAESYEVSDDGTVYTFHLRPDAKFADGTPITANDYYYTLKRALEGPGYITLLTGFMAVTSMDQVKVVDDYTLTITASQPAALAEIILSFQVVGAISQKTAEANATADDPWAENYFRTNSNSSGPYIITSWNPGVEYVFEPNPNYWRGADYFHNCKVIFRVVPDAATREQLLRAGDVDVALGVPYSDLAELEADPNITIHHVPTTRVYHAGMNLNQKPFDDVNVRKAVSMVVPYQAIIDNVIYGYGANPGSPIAEGMATHTDEFFTYPQGTVDEAKALLAQAGYPDGFTVDLVVPQEDQARVDSATWIQSGLATIGVTVNVNALPIAQYNELLNAMDANGKHTLPFYIFEWYSWGNDPAFQFTWNFKCGQFTNYTNTCNQELDQIIADLTLSRDPAERQRLSTRGQEIVVQEEVPWIYLYAPEWIIATRSNVSGIALFNDLTLRYAFLGKD